MRQRKKTTLIFGLMILYCTSYAPQGNAQVTIGSSVEARATTYLDLKENDADGSNSKKGLVFPRVELQEKDMLYPMYESGLDYLSNKPLVDEKHTGLTVYNVTDNQTFSEGSYQWDGEKWLELGNHVLAPAATGEIDCDNVRLYPEIYEAGKPYKGVLIVPYFNGNGGYYIAGTVINNNNFTIKLRPGKLSEGYGELYFEVSSDSPTFSSPNKTKISIYNLLGNTISCQNILVGGEERGYSSIYSKKTGRLHSDGGGKTWDATYQVVNHLRIAYRKNLTEKRINVGSTENAYITYYWLKSGEGGLDFWTYGQIKSQAGSWGPGQSISNMYTLADGDNTSSGGPSGNKPNFTASNRDIGQIWLVFHNAGYEEVYRVTVNVHEKLGATNNGYCTFFTELMK